MVNGEGEGEMEKEGSGAVLGGAVALAAGGAALEAAAMTTANITPSTTTTTTTTVTTTTMVRTAAREQTKETRDCVLALGGRRRGRTVGFADLLSFPPPAKDADTVQGALPKWSRLPLLREPRGSLGAAGWGNRAFVVAGSGMKSSA